MASFDGKRMGRERLRIIWMWVSGGGCCWNGDGRGGRQQQQKITTAAKNNNNSKSGFFAMAGGGGAAGAVAFGNVWGGWGEEGLSVVFVGAVVLVGAVVNWLVGSCDDHRGMTSDCGE